MTRLRRIGPPPFAGVEPFGRYPARAVAPLARHADRLAVRPGTVLAHEGRRAREAYVVLAGAVRITCGGRSVGRAGPGTVLGADDVLGDGRATRTLTAGPDLEVVVVPERAVRWGAEALPGLWDRAVWPASDRMAPCRSASTSPSTVGSADPRRSPAPRATPRTSASPASG